MRWFTALLAAALTVALLFLVIPVAAIFANTAPSDLIHSLGDASARDALRLSLETSLIALAIYERFATDLTGALALSAVLVAVSGALLASVKLAGRRALA